MVAGLDQRFYSTVSRYSGSAFVRMKLREGFPEARTHIFETRDQARAYLDSGRTWAPGPDVGLHGSRPTPFGAVVPDGTRRLPRPIMGMAGAGTVQRKP